MYVVIGLENGIPWPTEETKVNFKNHEITLRPATDRTVPSVVITYYPPETFESGLSILRQFLSSLCWVEGNYLREITVSGGGVPI